MGCGIVAYNILAHKETRRFLSLFGQIAVPGELGVLCRDFNVEPGSETLHLLSEAGFVDLLTQGSFPGTRTSLYPKAGRFTDHMLVNQPRAVRGFTALRTPEVSDHCPLVLYL